MSALAVRPFFAAGSVSFDELAANLHDIAETDVGCSELVLISNVPLKRLEFGEGYGTKWTRESDGHRRWAGPKGDVDAALALFLLGILTCVMATALLVKVLMQRGTGW